MEDLPKVSVVIPVRNEEKYISKCIESLLESDYPKDKLEILVVDGMSEDNTRKVANSYEGVRVLDNPSKYTPHGINIGIKNSTGQVVMFGGAHTVYSKNYISECVKALQKGYDAAGGRVITLPRSQSPKAVAIAGVLSHPFGTASKYRTGEFDRITEVDTAAYALYRRDVFDELGYFNEELVRNQDIEFNLRIRRAGKRIALVPSAESYYFARDTIKSLFENNFGNGFWVIWGARFARMPFSLRHLVPFAFVLFLGFGAILTYLLPVFRIFYLLIVSLYAALVLFTSGEIAFKARKPEVFPWAVLSFLVLHVSYGLGSFWAFLKILWTAIFGQRRI